MSRLSTKTTENVVIRKANAEDGRRLLRLAGLDSAPLPAAPALVAEVDGELRAAYSVSEGRVIADPFQRTDHLVELLAVRAAHLEDGSITSPSAPGGRRLEPAHQRLHSSAVALYR